MCPRATRGAGVKKLHVAARRPLPGTPPVRTWPLALVLTISLTSVSAEMCPSIQDDLGASSCTEISDGSSKGFRLVADIASPLRYAGLGFDDNIMGDPATPGAQNVCMLAAFGNGGVVDDNCVPIVGTTANEFNGNPEQHYFGMEGFDCGFNFMAYSAGDTINWNYPLGNTCIGDADLDLGLTSIYCMFSSSCGLGGAAETTTTTTTVTTGTTTSATSTATSTVSTISSTYTATSITATQTLTSFTATATTVSATSTLTTKTATTSQTMPPTTTVTTVTTVTATQTATETAVATTVATTTTITTTTTVATTTTT
ncbi:unnamed protein product, partial [Effrenium voratum]